MTPAAPLAHRLVTHASGRPVRLREMFGRAGSAPTEIAGRCVLITGASSGIGESAALQFADAGAEVVVVARRTDRLEQLTERIRDRGGVAFYYAADLSDPAQRADLIDAVNHDHGGPDVLINNAGRSIRRRITDSTDRLHDYERTMAINYFGPVQLSLGFLPGMREQGYGQIINVSTAGVMGGLLPRFSAYASSKAALTYFGRTMDAELRRDGIRTTTVYYPLVKTAMMAPTAQYQGRPALSPDEAAEWLLHAVQHRPVEVYPRAARGARLTQAVLPARLVQAVADRVGAT